MKITKTYKEKFPKCRFVGKLYKNSDRVNGMYGWHWGQWFENDWFAPLEELITDEFKANYPEAGSSIGLMRGKEGESEDYFEYWIGMFLPENCIVPEGYNYIDIPNHTNAGICWIKGEEGDVYCHEMECLDSMIKNGMTMQPESDGGAYMFERYNSPRFTTPDENNEIILDLGFFVD